MWDYYVHVSTPLEDNFCKEFERRIETTPAMKRIESKRIQYNKASINNMEQASKDLNRLSREYELKKSQSASVFVPIRKTLVKKLVFSEIKNIIEEVKL